MKFNLPLYMSDETRRLMFSRLQMLAAGLTYVDEDDGRVPEAVEIRAGDDGCVPEDVEIMADLTVARGLVDIHGGVDATSQATTITKLTQATELGGGVHSTRLAPEKLDSTPCSNGGLLFSAGGNEDDSVEDALHEAENESLRSGSLFMPCIEDDGNEDGDNYDRGASPSRNIMMRSRAVPGVDTAAESEAVPDGEGDANVSQVQGVQGSPSRNLRCRVPVGARPDGGCAGTVGGHGCGSSRSTNVRGLLSSTSK
jgi:hypothetical protein